MGYSHRYDTHYDDESGEWLEKIGFCDDEDDCLYCKAYNEDGRPKTAWDAPKDALEIYEVEYLSEEEESDLIDYLTNKSDDENNY